MAKIAFDKWKNSMSFMIDDKFDNSFLQTITPLTRLINESCINFANPEELSIFLTTDSGKTSSLLKLKAFISVIGLSEERLKRVVSLIRFKIFGEEFRTEWPVSRISRALNSNNEFKNLLIEFFINGRNSRIGKEIP